MSPFPPSPHDRLFYWTSGYARRLRELAGTDPETLARRHLAGDWGACPAPQRRQNNRALLRGGVVVSVFPRPEAGFASASIVFTDSANQCTTITERGRLREEFFFDLGHVWVTAAARKALIETLDRDAPRSSEGSMAEEKAPEAKEAAVAGSERRSNALRVLLLRHGLADGGDLAETEGYCRAERLKSLHEASLVRSRLDIGGGECLWVYTDRERGHTAVFSSTEGRTGSVVVEAICRRNVQVSRQAS